MNTLTKPALPLREFVPLLALMISVLAMSIDAVLPALPLIGRDLQISNVNNQQLVISALFLGFAVAQLFFGPLSDSIGRKRAIYIGYMIFLGGTLLAIFASSFAIMLLGRVLQGMGAAAPRVVTHALVRDQYQGRKMAQILSFVMAFFVLVPMLAPALGQGILMFGHWRMIFVLLIFIALIAWGWFALRQPETLPDEKRIPFAFVNIWAGIKTTLSYRVSLGYTLLLGLVAGAFITYISTSQQIFSKLYGIVELFPLYFAMLAGAVGFASIINGQLVMKLGMHKLAMVALFGLLSLSSGFLIYALFCDGVPPLWHSMGYFFLSFMCIGLLLGNVNAIAMEPLGHIAGVGAAVVGSLSTLIAALLGASIGLLFNGTLYPLLTSFALLSSLALLVMWWVEMGRVSKLAVEGAV